MSAYDRILDKLNGFSKKYYTKMLVQGTVLFLTLGLLFMLIILGLEYFLWLGSTGRLILLLIFILVESVLAFKYILTPIFYLFRLKKGISNREASLLIGKHFSEVKDKLFNLLELADNNVKSELLLASIDQRSNSLNPIPFANAINFRDTLKYMKYLVVPLLIIGIIGITGNLNSFFGSYERVVNYETAYEPPAPFEFKLLSGGLSVLENETFTIQVTTEGRVKPEDVYIRINEKEFLLQEEQGLYTYTFMPPLQSVEFSFLANDVVSRPYSLEALKTPAIQTFQMVLNYPDYTQKSSEIIKSTGNATFPEGTEVSWEIQGLHTKSIHLNTADSLYLFNKSNNEFRLNKRVYSNMEYQLSTSNDNVDDFEKLYYKFQVIKDAYPSIKVQQVQDSLNPNISYFAGEASDDYELASIALIYYPAGKESEKEIVELGKPNTNFNTFYYTYPSGLRLEEGVIYSFYFQARDNDALRGGKIAKSQVFGMTLLDDNQLKDKQLEFQQSILRNMDKSLDGFKEQQETLKEINREQKEKSSLNYNDQNQIKDFLKKQEQQEELMQKFSKQLKENLNEGQKDDELNKLLQERLERQELAAKKNEKLLKELNEIADKIKKEELAKRLEELAKQQQNSQRSLEQLLELTKRYYVTEKAAQLAQELEKLAQDQENLSELEIEEEKTKGEQEQLSKDFEELAKELEELEKDNQALKKPLKLDINKTKEEAVKKDQKEALDELQKHEELQEGETGPQKEQSANTAKQKQKSAAQKMREMSEDLQKSSSGSGGGSTITEDAEMLRQILDNLVTFSFKQEQLYETLENADLDVSYFSSTVRKQRELRDLFEHVDDSLFALSLRRAELSEFVNGQITDVYYNIDKAMESMAENRIYQGVSYQQYVLTASNSLADFLANILENMQQSMSQGAGSGSSAEGFQLPDIIKGQGELKEKMGEMGEMGKQGKQGQQGKDGDQGQGKGDQEGENGEQSGKNGKSKGEGEGEGEGEGGNEQGGSSGEGGNGENEGGQGQGEPSEVELREIYEIYKEQQQIRQELEKQLNDMIRASDKHLAQKLIRQMEDFENDLLENGITQRTISKMNTIEHQLLKLENAALKQGQKLERESHTNTEEYVNPITTKPAILEDYRNEIEILNRQALPLRQIYQEKVKNYFKKND